MTETRTPYVVQTDFWAGDQVAGNVEDRCRRLLELYPDARSDYQRAYFLYLRDFCGLGALVRDTEAFWHWFEHAPDYRTVSNRIQDLMRANADLRPPPAVQQRRQRQRRQGKVK